MIKTIGVDKYGRNFVKFEDGDGETTISDPSSPESIEMISKIEAAGSWLVVVEEIEKEMEAMGKSTTFDYREF